MRKLITAFYKSIYDFPWLKGKRFFPKDAWKYFLVFIFAFTFVSFIPQIFFLAQQAEVVKRVVNNVPDFGVEFTDGKLKISKLKQPYYQKVSEDFAIVADSTGINPDPVGNFITSTTVSYLFIGPDKLKYYNARTGMESEQKWSALLNSSITKAELQDALQKSTRFPYAVFLLLVIFAVFYFMVIVSNLYSVLMVSLIASIAAKFRGVKWKWKEIFAVTLFAITLPSLMEIVITLTGLQISYIHFIALLSFMLAVVFTETVEEQDDGRVV